MTTERPIVAVVGQGWSSNIGNAFFNLGTLYLLRQSLPHADIRLVSDQPAYWDFVRHLAPRGSLKIVDYVQADYVVLHGSVLTRRLPEIWGDSLRKLRTRGTRLVLLSCGLFEYSQEEIDICRNFLKHNKPVLLAARDRFTYKHFCDVAESTYDGIDSAFFLPNSYIPTRLHLPPYVVLNFDKRPEPTLGVVDRVVNETRLSRQRPFTQVRTFAFRDRLWSVKFPLVQYGMYRVLGKLYPYVAGLLGIHGGRQAHVSDLTIVRTDHQSNPMVLGKVFRAPNMFSSDIPYSYVDIYSQSELILTDRVHACVAGLAYGRSAMLFSDSERRRVLSRVGADEITTRPVSVSCARLADEKAAMLEYLKSVFV